LRHVVLSAMLRPGPIYLRVTLSSSHQRNPRPTPRHRGTQSYCSRRLAPSAASVSTSESGLDIPTNTYEPRYASQTDLPSHARFNDCHVVPLTSSPVLAFCANDNALLLQYLLMSLRIYLFHLCQLCSDVYPQLSSLKPRSHLGPSTSSSIPSTKPFKNASVSPRSLSVP